jgi:hypothetical protein
MSKAKKPSADLVYESFSKLSAGQQIRFYKLCLAGHSTNVIAASARQYANRIDSLRATLARAFECWGHDEKKLEHVGRLNHKGQKKHPDRDATILRLKGQGDSYRDIAVDPDVVRLNGSEMTEAAVKKVCDRAKAH